MHADSLPAEPRRGHRLAEDLIVVASLGRRRRSLAWLVSSAVSPLLLDACGGGGGSASASTPNAVAAATSTAATTTSACIADATETRGPYPDDGTNTAARATSDILAATGIVRSDIRTSFLSSTTTAACVPMKLTLTLVNTNAGCSTLQGFAIYLWHCDRSGNDSLYTAAAESYLRGVQVTDSNGQVNFTSIIPGCYSGRYPHIHFEVFARLAAAKSGRNAALTSQLALPAAVANAGQPVATGHGQSAANFAQVSIASDRVFGDDSAAQITMMTPTMTDNATDGDVTTSTIGVAR